MEVVSRSFALVVACAVLHLSDNASAEPAPLSVWVIGDSTAQPLEQGFAALGKETPHVKVRSFFKNSSGLIRTDVIDWAKTMRGMLAHGAPNVAIITFGPNDAQGLVPAGKRQPVAMGTEEWRDEYAKRVRAFVDLFRERGTEVFLLTQPFDENKKHAPLMRDVNAGIGKASAVTDAETKPPIHLVDVPELLAAESSDKPSGALKNVDGIHLTFVGGKYLARTLYTRIDSGWAATRAGSTSSPR